MPIVELLCPLDYNAAVGSVAAEWVRALARTGDRTVPGRVRIPLRKTFSFGTLAIPFAPLCQSPLTLKLTQKCVYAAKNAALQACTEEEEETRWSMKNNTRMRQASSTRAIVPFTSPEDTSRYWSLIMSRILRSSREVEVPLA